ncbi:hypothetical protein PG993_009836 [Apiospora rasikravindrae]|uniref:Uncharacterized protein n=1 Tax=Apiospora rasikravindrae TaxID=990691 RepID=A0ABR1SKI8_9PEZI
MPVSTSDDESDNDQAIFGAPSGPCLLCGRPSAYTCPFKADTFQCEFLCSWPVPRDIRARLRRIKEQEERRDAEFWGYEADDEKEGGNSNAHAQDMDDAAAAETTVSGVVPVGGNTTNDAKGDCVSSDADDVDGYGEMHKTLFPEGAPRRPVPSKKTQGGTAVKDIGDGGMQIATSGKRKSKGHNEDNNKDRPAKKSKKVDGPSTTVAKDPADCFKLGGRHSLPRRKAKLGFADWLSWK